MKRTYRRVLIGLALGATLGCADPPEASELLISVATDFAGGELSHLRVETLAPEGEGVADARWLRVGEVCPTRADGLRTLGTFRVERGEQALARLHLTALRSGADGKVVEVARERVDAAFARGRVTIDLTLSKLCSGVACTGETTCDPAAGACRPVQRVALPASASEQEVPEAGCITPLTEAPPEVVMRMAPATGLCVSGDRRCDAPCPGQRDADCLYGRGEACLVTADCIEGALCVHGVCCDKPCGGACERCDLAERAGTCTPLRYLDTRAPRASPDFTATCSDHVAYACTSGSCQARCSAGFSDCNQALQEDGCETPLGSAEHCRACGDACRYGYCGDEGCSWHHTTGLETSASRRLAPDKLFAIGYVPNSEDRVVRALGALVDPDLAGATLRLALYAGNAAGSPDKLLAQTAALARSDAAASEVTQPEGTVRLEGRISPVTIDPGEPYFVVVQVAQPLLVFGAADSLMPWYVATRPYEAFPAFFPAKSEVQEFIALTMYAVTTPH